MSTLGPLDCHCCRGAGSIVTRVEMHSGEPLARESCDRCYGTGRKSCLVCEKAPASELDSDGNPLCAGCAAKERAIANVRCPCGSGRVIAVVGGKPRCDRCLTVQPSMEAAS